MTDNLDSLTPFDDETERFSYVPQLSELLQYGGSPGYTYAQVCTHNLMKGRKDGYSLVNRDAYLIEGSKGQAEMILMVKGEENTLLSPTSGMRKCFVDKDVAKLTGIQVEKEQAVTMAPPVKPAAQPQSAGSK